MKEKTGGLRTWIEVDKRAVQKNITSFRSLIDPECRLMAVVKSNAYGHGLHDFSRLAVRSGVDWLGVDSMVEASALRDAGIRTPILVLGYTLPDLLRDARSLSVSITISHKEHLRVLATLPRGGKPLTIHLKADTGMHRQGFLESELAGVKRTLVDTQKRGSVTLEGLYTHFAAAKNPAFPEDTKRQLNIFEKWRKAFASMRPRPIFHAAATGGVLLFPESHFDMVRVGIGLYGIWPSPETRAARGHRFSLHPAPTWKTIIGETKRVRAGERVGYDLTERLTRPSLLGIAPVGYWHGYPRALSCVGGALVRGRTARVLGRVSMDMLILDCTDVPRVQIGDEVVLIGSQGKETISADHLASLADLSPYELITRLNPLIKRIYK